MNLRPSQNEYFVILDLHNSPWTGKGPFENCITICPTILMDYLQAASAALQTTITDGEALFQMNGTIDLHCVRGVLLANESNFYLGHLRIYNSDSLRMEHIDAAQKLLALLHESRANNITIMEKLRTGNLVPGDKFITINTGWHSSRTDLPWKQALRLSVHSAFTRFILVEGVRCPICRAPVTLDTLKAHRAHPLCKIMKDTGAAEGAQLTRMDFDVGLAARQAGIPTEMVGIKYDIYAPTWVAEAVKTYHTISKDGPYAEMPLTEFLSRMKPDSHDPL